MDNAKISAAFVRAQRDFGPALKTSTNPHFKSRYADLAACVEAVVGALNVNGIALLQRSIACDEGVCVETVFVHESGESMSSGPLHVPASKQDPQGYGSALTYARRYSLMAACGIAPEDDDGNAGSKTTKRGDTKPKTGGDSGSPTAILFHGLPADWQDYLRSLAVDVENTFESAGAGAAKAVIDAATDADDLDGTHLGALYSLLPSKTRSQMKALPRKEAA